MNSEGGVRSRRFLAERVKGLKASEIRELLKLTEGKDVISLAGGLPDPETFPKEELAEVARRVVMERGEQALQYSPTKGVTEFRRVLRDFLAEQGVELGREDDIIVTTGSQEALYLIGKLLIDPGDVVFVEAPTYLAALNAFSQFGARFMSAPVDEDGMKTDVLEERVREAVSEGLKAKFIYTIPTSQNPSGVTMSMERRKHLLEIAEKYDLLVVEDDPYSFFTFEPVEVKPLKTLDKSGRVVYLGTLSKILSPGLRVGWAAGESWLITAMELAKQSVDLHSSTLSQFIAMEAIRRGLVLKTVEKARKIYKVKRDVMLEALEEYFPQGCSWTRPVGGLFIFAYLPEGIDTKKLLPEALERGVAYVPGASFFAEGGGENTMRLNFSYPSIAQIREGIRRLGLLLKERLGD